MSHKFSKLRGKIECQKCQRKTWEGMYFCILRSVFGGGMCFRDAAYFQRFKEFVGKDRDTRWEETSSQCFLA